MHLRTTLTMIYTNPHFRILFQQQVLNAKSRHTYVAIMVVMFVLFILSRNFINFLNLRYRLLSLPYQP